MNKVFHPEFDQAELIKAAGKIVTLVDGSSNQRIKSAASSAVSEQLIRENLPDDNHFAVHLIALGDGEEYGPNRNNDYFSKRANKKYHPTFVSHGHFFREHNNRDPKNAIGIVKASAHNDDMSRVELIIHGDKKKAEEEYELLKKDASLSFSMSCFPAGTKVSMYNGTLKNIEDIAVGDEVITHLGNVGKVSHTLVRDYDDDAIELHVTGVPYPIVATKDHPIWVRPHIKSRTICPACGKFFKQLQSHINQKTDDAHKRLVEDFGVNAEGFTLAENITTKDFVRIPVNKDVVESIDEDKAWLLGLYIAEGHIYKFIAPGGANETLRVEFTLNKTEEALANRVIEVLSRYAPNNKVASFKKIKNNALAVRLTTVVTKEDSEIIEWLAYHGGKLAGRKKLSDEAMKWSYASQKRILEGWIDGDGTWNKINNKCSATTIAENLVFQMQILAARNGLESYISKHDPKAKNKQRFFILNFSRFSSQRLNLFEKKKFVDLTPKLIRQNLGHLRYQEGEHSYIYKQPPQSYVDAENGHMYVKVRKVKKIPLSELVYDLTVPGDHGFVANGIGVSNCKIASDVCNCCGNKAANRSQYCDCMRHHAGEYMPEFKKFAYVDNPDPVFFDISRVKSPADRIAHYLEYVDGALSKAAHAHKPILGAELAELEGVNLPHSPDEYFNQQERKILQKLAYNEAYLENVFKGADVPRDNKYNFTKYALNMIVPRDTADKSIVEGLCTHDLPILMRKLATAKVILPFRSFYSMINGEDPETLDFDPTYKHACAAVPNTFRSLEDGSNKVLQVGFTSSYFDPACEQVDACNTDEFEKAMDYFIHKFSLRQLEEPTVQIIQVSAQPSLSEDFKMKEASVVDKNKSEIAVGLYGLYKLSCCKQLASELDDPKYLTITYLK